MASKSKKDLQLELRMMRRHGIGNNVTKVLIHSFRWGGLGFIALETKEMILGLAGHHTFADISIYLRGFFSVDEAGKSTGHSLCVGLGILSLVIVGALIAWAMGERILRKKAIEHLHPRVKYLEKLLDKGRSSSGLDSRGDTKPEDK